MPNCKHCEKKAGTSGLCKNHYMQAWSRANKESVKRTKAAYYQKKKEEIKAKTAAYAKANVERTREYKRKFMRQWLANNREESRKRVAAYRVENPEKVIAYRRKYDAENVEKNRKRRESWKSKNPELIAFYRARRRERTKVGKLPRDVREKMLNIYRQCRLISKETGIKHHVDHIIPLARGGAHHPDNLQIITATENHRKHAKLPEEMFA